MPRLVWLYREGLRQGGQGPSACSVQFDVIWRGQGYICPSGQILERVQSCGAAQSTTRFGRELRTEAIKNGGRSRRIGGTSPLSVARRRRCTLDEKSTRQSHYGYKNHVNWTASNKLGAALARQADLLSNEQQAVITA